MAIFTEPFSLDHDQVRRAVDFHLAYAKTCAGELDELGELDVTGRLPIRDAIWTIRSDEASALREASEWAMLLDQDEGALLMDRAGRAYVDLGHPYGLFLRAVASADADVRHSLFAGMKELAFLAGTTEPDSLQRRELQMPAMRHPQQQAYFVLAASSAPQFMSEMERPLRGLVMEGLAQHGRSGVPIGPMNTPLRRYWLIARSILSGQPDVIVEHLVAMVRTYGEVIESARANRHTWSHAAAPVSVAESDLVGLTHLSHRALGSAFASRLRDRIGGLTKVEAVPLLVGLSIRVRHDNFRGSEGSEER